MEIEQGTIVDRYTIEGRLGEGGMAVVYKARHNQLGTMHAIKVLTIPGKSIRQRLLQEGRVQALLRHPNIVTVTDVIDVEGQPGLVMEMIEGMSLEQLIEKMPLSVEQADVLARGIIEGVGEAHRQELIHRDLKPGNVMVQFTQRGPIPKVTDFGLAKVLSADEFSGTKTRAGQAMGTPCYMAPEQIRDASSVDKRADIWALGAILYELLTQRRAFDGADMFAIFSAVTSGEYPKIRTLIPDVPERMEKAIEACLVIDRDKRCGDCDTLLALWTGKASDLEEATTSSAASLWGADMLKSVAPKSQAKGAAGTWSGDDGEITKSIQPGSTSSGGTSPSATPGPAKKRKKSASKAPSADTITPEELRSGQGQKVKRPVTYAPTGIIAPPGAADRSSGGTATAGGDAGAASKVPIAIAVVAVLLLLVVSGVALVSLGIAGGVLASSSTASAPVATPEDPDETSDKPEKPVKAPVVKAPEVKAPEVKAPEVASTAAPETTAPETKAPDTKAPIKVSKTPVKTTEPIKTVESPPAATGKGLLIVNSRPWSNITLDGTSAQRTGGWKREVSAGKHTIELTTADGQKTKQSVDVKANGETTFCWDFALGAPCPK